MGRIWKLTLMSVTLILIDQFAKGYIQSTLRPGLKKHIIGNFLNIVYVKNPGVAFGLFAENPNPWILLAVNIFTFGIILWLMYLIILNRNGKLLKIFSFSLIIAGAFSNLFDRIFLKYVVDYIELNIGKYMFPAFNLADFCITMAGIFLIYEFSLLVKEKQK